MNTTTPSNHLPPALHPVLAAPTIRRCDQRGSPPAGGLREDTRAPCAGPRTPGLSETQHVVRFVQPFDTSLMRAFSVDEARLFVARASERIEAIKERRFARTGQLRYLNIVLVDLGTATHRAGERKVSLAQASRWPRLRRGSA